MVLNDFQLSSPTEISVNKATLDFKEMFHACDIDPDSIMAYNESMNLVKSLEQHEMGSLKRAEYCFLTLDFLGVKPGIGSRRALRDVVRAYVMIAPFFPGLPDHSIASFLASKYGKRFQGSKLFEPSQRTQVPNQRSHTSNRYRPKDFWKEWKDIENDKKNKMALAYAYPQAWDKLARPILAKCKLNDTVQRGFQPNSLSVASALKIHRSDSILLSQKCYR